MGYCSIMENNYRIECHWPEFPFFSPRVVRDGLSKEQAEKELEFYRNMADNGQVYNITH